MTNQQNRFLESLGNLPGPWYPGLPYPNSGIIEEFPCIRSNQYEYGIAQMCDIFNVKQNALLLSASPQLLCSLMQVYNSNYLKDLGQQLMIESVAEQATGKKFDEVQKLWKASFEEEPNGKN